MQSLDAKLMMAAPFVPPVPPPTTPCGQYPPPGMYWSQSNAPCYHNPSAMPPGRYYQPSYPPPLFRPPMDRRPPAVRSWYGGGRGRGNGPSRRGQVFECKACNKTYKSDESYRVHMDSHVKCSQCEFKGSSKTVRGHELLHIMPEELKFSSDEDIQKWREQRKRNYPTAENVAKKKQLEAEKKDRGESAITSLYKYVNRLIGEDGRYEPSHRGGRGRGRGQRGRTFNQRGRHRQWAGPRQDGSAVDSKGTKGNVPRDNGGSKDDSKVTDDVMSAILTDCNVLPSTGEDDGRGEEGEPSTKKQRIDKQRKWTSRRERKRAKAANGIDGVLTPRKPTLLEKLLAPEIRHEENALLQCIRHITASDYFMSSKHTPENSTVSM